jgi:molybdopterin/thiamine biosynthesis adenylyltransferase
MEKLEMARIVVCGVGALGSQLVDNLARHGAKNLLVIDKDRVEEHNIGTQIFERGEIGAWKAEVVASRVFRATGAEIEGVSKELTTQNIAKWTRGADVVVDCFDNSASRALLTNWCRENGISCLHLGVNADYGEVKWNEKYQIPGDVEGVGACDYPLARNLLLFIVAIGSEALLHFLWRGEKRDFSFTLGDFSINFEN